MSSSDSDSDSDNENIIESSKDSVQKNPLPEDPRPADPSPTVSTVSVIPVKGTVVPAKISPELNFTVKDVIGMTIVGGRLLAIVHDEDGKKQFVDPKSVARQNLDVRPLFSYTLPIPHFQLMFDFLLQRIHTVA